MNLFSLNVQAHAAFLKKTLLMLLLMLPVTPGTFSAKAQETTGHAVTLSTDFIVATAELGYETRLTQLLSGFFKPDAFYVKAHLFTDKTIRKYKFKAPEILYRERANPLLPGLPYLPQEYLNEDRKKSLSEEPQQYQTLSEVISLKNIRVDIYADTSLTAQDLDIMRSLAKIAVKADSGRGDIINISQLALPAASASKIAETAKVMEQLMKEHTPAQSVKTQSILSGSIILLLLAILASIWLRPVK